jgi:hypothetical protein
MSSASAELTWQMPGSNRNCINQTIRCKFHTGNSLIIYSIPVQTGIQVFSKSAI